MLEQLIFLILGIAGLVLGADFLIKGTKNLAMHLGLSHFIIGLAFVSIGTSIPEIAVSVAGGVERLAGVPSSGIVVGDILGSALSQITLILGVLAFLVPLQLKKKVVMKQGAFLIAAILLFFVLGFDGYFSRFDGVIFIVAYLVYYVSLWQENHFRKPGPHAKIVVVENLMYALVGLGLVLFASDVVVKSGVEISEILGVNHTLIGIFLVGVGTGLPEFTVALASFKRRAMGISMGTLIGSNICDMLLALGSGTVISGFVVNSNLLWFDVPVLLIFTLIVLSYFFSGHRISKREGGVLIVLFVVYAVVKIFITG